MLLKANKLTTYRYLAQCQVFQSGGNACFSFTPLQRLPVFLNTRPFSKNNKINQDHLFRATNEEPKKALSVKTQQFLSDSNTSEKPQTGTLKSKMTSQSEIRNSQIIKKAFDQSFVDTEVNQVLENEKFKETLAAKSNVDPMAYFYTYSSSYYQKSQIKFDKEVKKFESRLAESLSDVQKHMNDIIFSDGYNSGRGKNDDIKHNLGQGNYRFQSHLRSGYETTMEMPKAKLAQALAVPILVCMFSGLFIFYSFQLKFKSIKPPVNK